MSHAAGDEKVAHVVERTCAIVGGGPAGMILAYLLARKGVAVTLLESHKDFDRDFRGDTIHPSTLEILDRLGLVDKLLAIPHGKIERLEIETGEESITVVDFHRLNTKFPYIMMMPQAKFLDLLAEEGKKFGSFELILGANVHRLVQEGGQVKGVRYRGSDDAWHEVRAQLTVAADGRFSKIRDLLGIKPIKSSPPMDVVWFRLPKEESDGQDRGAFYAGGGVLVVVLDRGQEWQIAFAITKGSYRDLKHTGIEHMQESLRARVPWLGDRVKSIEDWTDTTVLSVESSRIPTWHQPGVLLIGDAAHVMSPVGGVGINYAIQDAVVAANLLAEPLRSGTVDDAKLAEVQKEREWPVKVIQKFQSIVQQRIVKSALNQADQKFRLPFYVTLLLQIPGLRNLPGQLLAFGMRRVHLRD